MASITTKTRGGIFPIKMTRVEMRLPQPRRTTNTIAHKTPWGTPTCPGHRNNNNTIIMDQKQRQRQRRIKTINNNMHQKESRLQNRRRSRVHTWMSIKVPMARACPSEEELLRCQHVIVHHLSLAQCAGFAGGSFHEVQHIWRDLQFQWATEFSDSLRSRMEALCAPHPDES